MRETLAEILKNHDDLISIEMKKTLLLIFSALVISCNSDDGNSSTSETTYHINQYFFGNMIYPNGVMENLDNLVKIEYDNNFNIVKRNGGYSSFEPSSGYPYIFTDNLYDQLTYSTNQILIEKKTTSTFSIPKFERKLFLDNNNRIIKKEIFREFDLTPRDTIYYSYNSNGKLAESRNGNVNSYNEVSKFYFNSANNLDSIVTRKYNSTVLQSKVVEEFSNYDSAINPVKNLLLFEETFYRSLTQNNFRKYERKEYDIDNNLTFSSFKNWTLIYDESGKVKFESH